MGEFGENENETKIVCSVESTSIDIDDSDFSNWHGRKVELE